MKPGNNTENDSLRDQYDNLWKNQIDSGHKAMGDLDSTIRFFECINLPSYDSIILEIGCGTGTISNWLVNNGFKSVTAIDLSQRAIDLGSKTYPNIVFKQMQAEKLQFPDGTFDICMSFDLVEHVPQIDKHLVEVARVLTSNGTYYLQTPNILTNSIAETIWNKGFSWRWQHPSLQSARSLKHRLLTAGFKEIRFVKISPISEYKLKQLPKLLRFLFKFLPFKKMPLFLQTNFWVIATK